MGICAFTGYLWVHSGYVCVHCGYWWVHCWYLWVHCGYLWFTVILLGSLWVHCWYLCVHCGYLWFTVVLLASLWVHCGYFWEIQLSHDLLCLCFTVIILLIWTAIVLLDIFFLRILQFLSHAILIKTKVLLPHKVILFRFWLSRLSPWVFMFPKTYKIIWLSNISAFGVRDENHSGNTSRALTFI